MGNTSLCRLNITHKDVIDMDFKTSDIVLASTLKTKGFTLATIELIGSRGVFVFKDVSQEVLDSFDLGDILVEPNAFHQNVKQLTTAVRRKLTA